MEVSFNIFNEAVKYSVNVNSTLPYNKIKTILIRNMILRKHAKDNIHL